jgi:hypothetical protein
VFLYVFLFQTKFLTSFPQCGWHFYQSLSSHLFATTADRITSLLFAIIIVVSCFSSCRAQTPMSRCIFARATGGYTTPTTGSGGTCGFGPVSDEITIYTSGALTAPDDETYNGFPFLGPPLSITTGGVGLACGECFEITGPSGSLILMNADVCDKGCCSNCQVPIRTFSLTHLVVLPTLHGNRGRR